VASTLLVVEDEPLIRLGLVVALEDAGYAVVEAANADQAVRRMESRDDIRVLVTDVDMPGEMDGIALAHYVHRRWPPVRLIVISGKVGLKEIELPEGAAFFSKPYEEGRLLATVARMVDSGQRVSSRQ
jgi:DNA-binding NtrC family response regulator